MRRLAAVLAGLVCWLVASVSVAAPAPILIVISLDGFRAEYLDRGITPTLARWAREGVRAKAMRPSFPSVTEPNHYTLMTGLRPDHHGIVDNTMVDPAMPGMSFGGPHSVGTDADPRWWNGATPLWVTARRAGIRTASSQWPGSAAVVKGVPTDYTEARRDRPDAQIDQVLAWLDFPEAQRPRFIRLHLGEVDDMGHLFGPDHRIVNDAIARADGELGKLEAGLKARGMWDKVDIVVVSDHGMTATPREKVIYLDDLLDLSTVVVPAQYAAAGVDPLPGHDAEVAKVLLSPHEHFRCWRKADVPARLHYNSNRRVPDYVCLADLGWTLATRAGLKGQPPIVGNHGYDPAEPDMAAIFVARGPAFRSGVTLPTFDNVDVYPLLAKVLGVKPEPNDGHLREVAAAIR